MSAVEELERSITEARGRGDRATLERLQAEYRTAASPIRVTGPGSIRLVEDRSSPTVTDPPDMRSVSPVPSVVVIRPEARNTVVNEMLPLAFEVETGGLLVGHQDGDEIVVESIFGADGSHYLGERDNLRLNGPWCAALNRRLASTGLRIVGDVHSHRLPSYPSDTDLRGWQGLARALHRNHVGILIGPDPIVDEDRFARPTWLAFLATPDGALQPIALHFEIPGGQ